MVGFFLNLAPCRGQSKSRYFAVHIPIVIGFTRGQVQGRWSLLGLRLTLFLDI